MKLVGFRTSTSEEVRIASLVDQTLTVLGSREEFWRDPAALLSAGRATPSVPLSDVDVVPLVPPGARVICVGLNYRAHVAEGSYRNEPEPEHPTLFGRWVASLSVDGRSVAVPAGEDGLDWEGEIAAYVGSDLFEADADSARAAVIGYSTFNDITARRAQKLTSQWTLGKNADDSGPLGPLVTADDVGDLRDGLRIQTRVNGRLAQDGNSRDMIFDVGEVLSLISQTLTLRAGDVLCTGTPDGVGYARTPPWLLQPGDTVEVEIDRLGILTTPVVAGDAPGRTTTEVGP